jgi:hypothetical protein
MRDRASVVTRRSTGLVSITTKRALRAVAAAALFAALVPGSAAASFKIELDNFYYSTSPTSARVLGNYPGDPRPATVHFEYVPAELNDANHSHCGSVVDWTNAQRTPDKRVDSVDPLTVGDKIAGLQPNQGYCVRFAASVDGTTESDTSSGGFVLTGEPQVAVDYMRAVSPSEIQVYGQISPAGQDTSYSFTVNDSSQFSCDADPNLPSFSPIKCTGPRSGPATMPGDGSFHFLTLSVSGPWQRGQEYQSSSYAQNATAKAQPRFFIGDQPWKFGQPFVGDAGFVLDPDNTVGSRDYGSPETSAITTSGATLSADASGSGAPADVSFVVKEFKEDCNGSGREFAGGALPADYSIHGVTAKATGLKPNTTYCWVASATNDVGTDTSGDAATVKFTTLPTPAQSISGGTNAGTVEATATGVVTLAKVVTACGNGPCTYTSTASVTGAGAKNVRTAARKKGVTIATGRSKLKKGQRAPLRLKLTAAGKKLLAKRKTLAVSVVVNGKDRAGKKTAKTVRAKFRAAAR